MPAIRRNMRRPAGRSCVGSSRRTRRRCSSTARRARTAPASPPPWCWRRSASRAPRSWRTTCSPTATGTAATVNPKACPREIYEPVFSAREEYLAASWATLDKEHGGLEGWLDRAVGFGGREGAAQGSVAGVGREGPKDQLIQLHRPWSPRLKPYRNLRRNQSEMLLPNLLARLLPLSKTISLSVSSTRSRLSG